MIRTSMRKTLILALFVFLFSAGIASTTQAASGIVVAKATAKTSSQVKKATAKKQPVKAKKTAAKKTVRRGPCTYCRSLAEGVDKSKAANATQWKGLVIGMNDGEKSLVITEAPKLNRIKAYPQRSVRITDDTKIITEEGWDGDFTNLDIGYKIEVSGAYDPTKRIVRATTIEVLDTPPAPVTKTK